MYNDCMETVTYVCLGPMSVKTLHVAFFFFCNVRNSGIIKELYNTRSRSARSHMLLADGSVVLGYMEINI